MYVSEGEDKQQTQQGREQEKPRVSKLAQMSQENLTKAVFMLAWPVIIEMLLQSTVGIADTAMVGRLSPAAIAAVGLSNQIVMLALTIFAAVRTGSTVLIARLVGAGDTIGASKAAKQALLLTLIIGVSIASLGIIFPEAGLRLLGAAPEVVQEGIGYMRYRAAAVIFAVIIMTVTGILRGCGNTMASMRINVTVNILNIIFNWLFIFGKFGMPQMNTAGAGFATMLARAVGATAMIYVLYKGNAAVRLTRGGGWKLQLNTIKRILNVGIPAAMESIMLRGAQVFFTMIVTGLGTNMYAAHQVALRADSVAFMPGFGFAVAATTLVGQNLGAQQPEEAKRAGMVTIYMAMAFLSVVGVGLFLFSTPIMGFFTNEIEVIKAGAEVLRIMALALPFLAVARVAAGGLRGAGDTKYVMWGTGFSIWVARLGLAYVLVKMFGWGLPGAWMAMSFDHVVRAAIFFYRWQQGKWTTIKI